MINNENLNITNENSEETTTNQFNIQKKPEKSEYEQKEFDAQLIKSYIGKNHKKIITKNFSIPGLLFGPLYLIYRKLYIGIPIYFISSLLVFFFTNNLVASIIVWILELILHIVIAVKFKKIYMNRAYDDCMKIEEKYGIRPDSEIVELCQEQGGKSFFIVLILIISLSAVSFALANSLQMMFNINEPKTENHTEGYNTNQNIQNNEVESNDSSNNNVIEDNSVIENQTNNAGDNITNNQNNVDNTDTSLDNYITNNG